MKFLTKYLNQTFSCLKLRKLANFELLKLDCCSICKIIPKSKRIFKIWIGILKKCSILLFILIKLTSNTRDKLQLYKLNRKLNFILFQNILKSFLYL